MASVLALIAAFLFAVAATLQQKGALNLGEVSLRHPKSLARLVTQTWWLFGTLALFTGWAFQAGALDRGDVAIIQPLLVTTVIFALPLGYFLTKQHVGSREILGAIVIVIGLALFAVFGDPAGGRDNAPNNEWAIAIAVIAAGSAALLVFGSRGGLAMKAAVYGTVSGAMFGLSATLTKPVLTDLHESVQTRAPRLAAVRARHRRRTRLRPPAGVARHRAPLAVRCDGVGDQPDRQCPARDHPAAGAPVAAKLAHRRRGDRASASRSGAPS